MNKALILIDIQNDYFRGGKKPLQGMEKAGRHAARLAAEFRADGIPVVHIRHVSARQGGTFFLPETKGAEINPVAAPVAGEKIFIKHYPNAFRETGLKEFLDSLGIRELHIAGAMTNMCVDTTTRAAFDLGYAIVIHRNCCAAPGILGTKIIHTLFIQNLGSTFATIA